MTSAMSTTQGTAVITAREASAKQATRGRIAVFAHEGVGKIFLSTVLDVPYPLFCSRFELSHSSMSVIYFDEKKETVYPKLLQLSNDSHLYREGMPLRYNNGVKI